MSAPDSVTWERASDVRLYSVMLYPLLLQVAHPTVGAGVRDFSDFEQRPWDRLLRTLDYVSLIVYGGQDAIATGRRLRALHKGFTGTREDGERYYALEPEAYAWVHATLLETYVAGHAQFGTPMTPTSSTASTASTAASGACSACASVTCRQLAWLSGLLRSDGRPRPGPHRRGRSSPAFARPGAAAPGPDSQPGVEGARLPAAQVLRIGGVGLMTPDLRAQLGIEWSRTDEARFRILGAVSRSLRR